MATCICVYCSVFSNPNRAECESRGSWARSMVLWDQQSCVWGSESMGHLLGGRPIIQGPSRPSSALPCLKPPLGFMMWQA